MGVQYSGIVCSLNQLASLLLLMLKAVAQNHHWLYFPTWAEAPYFATESVNIGMLDTKQWTIDTSSTDSVFYVRETYGKGFSISTSGVFTLINSSFSRLTSWANQLDGKAIFLAYLSRRNECNSRIYELIRGQIKLH